MISKKYMYSVYCQLKDEIELLPFFIEHYFNLGFDHIYLMDDLSQTNISEYECIKKLDKSKITVFRVDFTDKDFIDKNENFKGSYFYEINLINIPKNVKSKQSYLIHWFEIYFYKESQWLFICDTDEYLYLKNHEKIYDYINFYLAKNYNIGQLLFLMCNFGTSYHSYFPKNKHLFESFILSNIHLCKYMKSLSNSDIIMNLGIHLTHNFIKSNSIYLPKPNSNELINFNDFNKQLYNLWNNEFDHNKILFNEVDAYLTHYFTCDCHNLIRRKYKRHDCGNMAFRSVSILNKTFELNNSLNTNMLKYIYTKNNTEDVHNQLKNIKPDKKIDFNKYNLVNNTTHNTLKDLIEHFYLHKTEIFFCD